MCFKASLVEATSLPAYFTCPAVRRSSDGRSVLQCKVGMGTIVVLHHGHTDAFLGNVQASIMPTRDAFSGVSKSASRQLGGAVSRKTRSSSLLQKKSCRGGSGVSSTCGVVGLTGPSVKPLGRPLAPCRLLVRLTPSQ